MQKWEYCHISKSRSAVAVIYITPSGEVPGPYVRHKEFEGQHELFRLIAKLGLEGWEMCGDGAKYFKRPIEESP